MNFPIGNLRNRAAWLDLVVGRLHPESLACSRYGDLALVTADRWITRRLSSALISTISWGTQWRRIALVLILRGNAQGYPPQKWFASWSAAARGGSSFAAASGNRASRISSRRRWPRSRSNPKSRCGPPILRLLAALAVLTTLGAADNPPPTPTLDTLGMEASKMKSEFPDRWVGYQDQVDQSVESHAKLVAMWRKRSSPPPLNLKPLGLPLAFLVGEARRLGEAPDALDPEPTGKPSHLPAVRFERHRSERHSADLDAIAGHSDDRRIEVLVEYRDVLERRWPGIGRSIPWPRLLTQAATRDWAVGQIRDLAREAPPFDPRYNFDVLPYRLIDRFAGTLPPDAATVAYDYLRAQDPLGPRNGERIWDLLLRLDPPRARREILPYFDSIKSQAFDFNVYVVMLLVKHAGPSAELAREARTWLAKDNLDAGFRRDIRVILLRADPAHEVKPAVESIDRLLAEQTRKGEKVPFQGEVHHLVLALGEVGTKEADDALARYVFERPIPDGIRALVLESLAKHDYPGTPTLLARWLAEESPSMRDHVRKKAAEQWGESGRRLLERVDRAR